VMVTVIGAGTEQQISRHEVYFQLEEKIVNKKIDK